MIINIRGTSGAGKSYLVRRLMDRSLEPVEPLRETVTQRDLLGGQLGRIAGYRLQTPTGSCEVIGSYEMPSGGTDWSMRMQNLTRDALYSELRGAATRADHVVYEGLIVADVNRVVALRDTGLDVRVLHIDIPLEQCLEAINERRMTRGLVDGVNPRATEAKARELRRQSERLIAAGVPTTICLKRETAAAALWRWLGWSDVEAG